MTELLFTAAVAGLLIGGSFEVSGNLRGLLVRAIFIAGAMALVGIASVFS